MGERRPGGQPRLSHAVRTRGPAMIRAAALLLALSIPLLPAPPFQERVQRVIGAYAHPKSAGPLGYLNIAAKLRLHEDTAKFSQRLEELPADPTGDMFCIS